MNSCGKIIVTNNLLLHNRTVQSVVRTSHFSPTVAVTAGSSAPFFSSVCVSASFVSSDRETTTLSFSPGTTIFTPRWASRSLANSVITAHLGSKNVRLKYKHVCMLWPSDEWVCDTQLWLWYAESKIRRVRRSENILLTVSFFFHWGG